MLRKEIFSIFFIYLEFSLSTEIVVFTHGESGYNCIRIPSLFRTSRGTLLAFGEGRLFNCNDDTQIDIVYKRSFDQGQTWSPLIVLYRGNSSSPSSNDSYNHVGNFAPVQLNYRQRILVPFCLNNRFLMQTYSDDDGLTFSQPEMIFNVTKSNWKWVALGPPAGLLLQSNRILIPGDYSTIEHSNGGAFSVGFVILNDFNGTADRWYLGGEFTLDQYYPNEGQAVELLPSENSIFINARSYTTHRIGAFSHDGGLTFNRVTVLNTLVQPLHGCQGSTIYDSNIRRIFYSGLDETSIRRTNLSLHMSDDQGENWTFVRSIYPGSSGYSSMIMIDNQSIGILFEKDSFMNAPASLTFKIIEEK